MLGLPPLLSALLALPESTARQARATRASNAQRDRSRSRIMWASAAPPSGTVHVLVALLLHLILLLPYITSAPVSLH